MLYQGADALVEAPELVLDEATRAAFARLAEILGSNRRLRYKLDAPKWMFLSWLIQTLPYVLHGSNRSRIRCFQPRFQPDAMGRPARSAYAAADGIWPIFYAVLDRRRYGGSAGRYCHHKRDGVCHHLFYAVDR